MRNNGQTKLMNRFWNWSKIFNNKECAGTLPTPGTCQADLYFLREAIGHVLFLTNARRSGRSRDTCHQDT